MNMISFANFENSDLFSPAPANGELPDGTEDFSALFTTLTLPQPPELKMDVPQPETQPECPVVSTETGAVANFETIIKPAPADAEPVPVKIEPLWKNMIITDDRTKPWQAKFGVERIATQANEGVLDPELTPGTKTNVTDNTILVAGLGRKIVTPNPRPLEPDYKKSLVTNGPVKPDVIVPGDTPPIIVPPTPTVTDPRRSGILNYQNVSEVKKTRDVPVVIPIIIPPDRTNFDGPPNQGFDSPEFPVGPTSVNENGGVLNEPPRETGGIRTPPVVDFPFDGPPRENGEIPDVSIEPTGVQVVEDVAFVPRKNLGGVKVSPFDLQEPEMPAILLTPRLDAGRISGFELSPGDVQSIAGTFEKFLKPIVAPNGNTGAVIKPATEPLTATTFQEIAEQIRATVQAATDAGKTSRSTGIMRAAEVIAEIRPVINAFTERSRTVKSSSVAPETVIGPSVETNAADNAGTTNDFTFFTGTAASKPVENKQAILFDPSDLSRRDVNEVNFEINNYDTEVTTVVEKQVTRQSVDTAQIDALWQQQMNPKEIASQVSPHLLELAAMAVKKNDPHSMKMRLNPAELGAVEIRIERSDNGQLNAYFQTESDTANRALSQNIDSLRDTLQNAGWQVGQMEVSTGGGSAMSSQQQQAGQQNRQPDAFSAHQPERGFEKPEPSTQDNSDRLLSLLA